MRLSSVYLHRTSSRAPGEAVGHGRGFIRREAARHVVVFVGWSLWGVKFPLTGRLRFSWWHVGVALADLYFMDVWVCARKDLYIWVVVDGLKSPDHVRLVFPYNVRFVIVVVWLRIYFCLWLHACWSRDCFLTPGWNHIYVFLVLQAISDRFNIKIFVRDMLHWFYISIFVCNVFIF